MDHYPDTKEIGYRVLISRKREGITQEELANLVGVSRDAITRIENGFGSRNDKTYKTIADVLNVSFDYLMTGCRTSSTKLVSDLLAYLSTIYDSDESELDDIINDLTRILNRYKIKSKYK